MEDGSVVDVPEAGPVENMSHVEIPRDQYRVVMLCVHGTHWMASRYVHGLLDHHGFDVHTVFFRETFEQVLQASLEELELCVEAILDLNPDAVGFNVTSMGYQECRSILHLLRQRLGRDVPVVWGGTHCTLRWKEVLDNNKAVDYVCRGEGDDAFIELLDGLRKGEDVTAIPNIYVNQPDGFISNPTRPLEQNLDALPKADYSDSKKHFIIQRRLYHEANPIPLQEHTYYINTARGCPFRCTFCGNSALANKDNGTGRYLRRRSVESVIAELKEAQARFPKLDFIYFWDDVFTAYPKWVLDFCEVYKKEIGLPFFCYTHPEMITEQLMAAMVDAGLSRVTMGIESGSYRVRSKIMNRHETDESIIDSSMIQADRGVEIHYDFILSAFETEEDKMKGLDLCLALEKPFKAQMHTMTYYPGYPITVRALKDGLIQPGDVVGAKGNQRRTQSMYAEDLKRNAYINYYFFTGKKWIPHSFVRFMMNQDVHNKHPRKLIAAATAMRVPAKVASLAGNYLRYVKYGHWKFLGILAKSYESFIELHIKQVEREDVYEVAEISDRFGAPVL